MVLSVHVDGKHVLHKSANHSPRCAPKAINRSAPQGARGRFSNRVLVISVATEENALSCIVTVFLFEVGLEVGKKIFFFFNLFFLPHTY